MKKKCTHDLIEINAGKYVILTITDIVPVSYCPQCGLDLKDLGK